MSFRKIFLTLSILFFIQNLYSTVFADDIMDLGADIFKNKAQCSVCHTLKAAGSEGQIGPNLDQLKASMDQIIYVVTNGIGVMQSWDGILTKKEIEAVAYYVFNSTNK